MKAFLNSRVVKALCAATFFPFIFAPACLAQPLPQIKTVFVIAFENHNFTQPNTFTNYQQILGNPAAPFLNSLIAPGNSNAAQVSYCAHYYNAGIGVHQSEPNYVWAEAGTDFGIHTDNDPSAASSNIFNAPHLTRQLNIAGIAWRNYEEDVEFSSSPTVSASGNSTNIINPYYGNGQYSYVARHNPMVLFSDTQTQNIYPLTQLSADLSNHVAGRYNWISPNLYNDQHSALSGGFSYHGVSYTGDQAAVAQGDNFLATILPQIMATTEYQDHGVIILRWDETEGGDSTNYTIPEIIISPLAKGNAYASIFEMNHSSDLKTMEKIFGLAFLSNAIPASETKANGSGYNTVGSVNDLSDLFQPLPPMFVGKPVLSNGIFQLSFTGAQGQSYQLMASDNPNAPMTNWVSLGGGTFGNSNAIFSDNDASNHAGRFYRIKSP